MIKEELLTYKHLTAISILWIFLRVLQRLSLNTHSGFAPLMDQHHRKLEEHDSGMLQCNCRCVQVCGQLHQWYYEFACLENCIIFEGINAISTKSLKEKTSEVVARVFTAEADKHVVCSPDRMRWRRTALDDGVKSHCNSCEGAKEGQYGLWIQRNCVTYLIIFSYFFNLTLFLHFVFTFAPFSNNFPTNSSLHPLNIEFVVWLFASNSIFNSICRLKYAL